MVLAAVWPDLGTEMAHWLFWHRNTHGTLKTPAKLSPSWKSPFEDPPSPKYTAAAFLWPLSFMAHAAPVACGIWVPTGTLIGKILNPGGACRPLSSPAP